MPVLEREGEPLHYRLDGPDDAPVLVLTHSLGTGLALWQPQLAAFSRRFRVLRHDCRGHGGSVVSPSGYGIDRLGRDVLRLLDGLGIARAHYCGLSMGGMIGIWLGVNAPERLERLVLCNTAARIGTTELWNSRIAMVEQGGMAAVIPPVLERWFTAGFLAAAPDRVAPVAAMLRACPAVGYAASCAAIRDMDYRDAVGSIRVPTLVIAGTHDTATPLEDGRVLAERIADARYEELPAPHLSNIETPERFTEAVLAFLAA
ncbi:MAG: 3-oxoadipate enol-lactonase [Magnetospirillum sp.]|nr:MAG: 3-oxoadipate enol-lactonase [Magnetospirillum sp.]